MMRIYHDRKTGADVFSIILAVVVLVALFATACGKAGESTKNEAEPITYEAAEEAAAEEYEATIAEEDYEPAERIVTEEGEEVIVSCDESQFYQKEYRFYDGEEEPEIEQKIEMLGRVYHLIDESAPLLEEGLPSERTYTFYVKDTISVDMAGEARRLGLTLTPAYGSTGWWREWNDDESKTFEKLPDNDVLRLPMYYGSKKMCAISYRVVKRDVDGIPTEYSADVLYRGRGYSSGSSSYLGGYIAEGSYTREGTERAKDAYVIIATYTPEMMEVITPPIDMEEEEGRIIETPEEESAGGGWSLLAKVVMGIAVGAIIALVAYLIWYYAVKKRRNMTDVDDEIFDEYSEE